MDHIYWSGPRESDIAFAEEMFRGSFTFYGNGNGANHAFCKQNAVRINHNLFNQQASDYILSHQLKCIEEDSDCLFMAYNPNCVFGAPEEILERTLCLNEESLMINLNNKLFFRELAAGTAKTLPMQIVCGGRCNYNELKQLFPSFSSFVIQEPISSGGQGTFWMNSDNAGEVFHLLNEQETYMVSGFVNDNIPVNTHAIIYEKEIVLFPGSIQLLLAGNNRLLYRGADYQAFKTINAEQRERFYAASKRLLEKVQALGYRGIIGIDGIITEEEVFLVEINNRFQGSSILLNKALYEQKLDSLQKMNLAAFRGQHLSEEDISRLKVLDVPYSMFSYVHGEDDEHAEFVFNIAQREKNVLCVLSEGYNTFQTTEMYAALFSVVFKGNISSICMGENRVRIHPNVIPPSPKWKKQILSGDLTSLKTALINRGVVLSDSAREYIQKHGDMRTGTYYALDIYLRGVYMNSPLYVKFAQLSPFEIDADEGKGLCLKYYGRLMGFVDYDKKEKLISDTVKGELPVDRILFLATDRLRIQNSACCTFEKHGVVCKFCEANGIKNSFSETDILKAIEYLFSNKNRPQFRHILLGGLSNEIGAEKETILNICHKIREYTDMPIYLMCLPPEKEEIQLYQQAGVTEFGFNLEIFDRRIAKQCMPGKGSIPVDKYLKALEEAVALCGNRGEVRTAFIVGLEPKESLLRGVEKVCQLGVAPILSAFRPIPGTEMSDYTPPSDEWLYGCMTEAEEICITYGLSLGPECPACRNNTLTLVRENEVKKIYSPCWRRED